MMKFRHCNNINPGYKKVDGELEKTLIKLKDLMPCNWQITQAKHLQRQVIWESSSHLNDNACNRSHNFTH